MGRYGGGLGVTDNIEGDGGSNMHTVDNYGQNNYVVLQFSQAVTVDKAYLGYVVNDSDMQVWIGNSAGTITTMSNAVLTSMGFTELNNGSSSARWADFNAGEASGNILIVAANTVSDLDDRFKLEKLVVCAPDPCAPVIKASIGNFVWEDKNANGIQDSGEAGIAGVTVKLLSSNNTVLSTTTTGAEGQYLFSDLSAGDYKVQVVAPGGYLISAKDQGGNDATDSDIDSTGTTVVTTLTAGENDLTWDAGLYLAPKASIGDRVWFDCNSNGVQDTGEMGVSGVTVKLLDAGGATVGTQTTDTNGTLPVRQRHARKLCGSGRGTRRLWFHDPGRGQQRQPRLGRQQNHGNIGLHNPGIGRKRPELGCRHRPWLP